MKMLIETFRVWWKKPTRVIDRDADREVSYLELFYDLAYVAIVIELTHVLAWHVDFVTLLQYMWLFAMVWWSWLNWSLYHELHWNNDIRTRVFTFFQMIWLWWMWIFIHNAFWEWYQWFAISYAFFLSILTFLWWRTWVHDINHKVLSTPYVVGFSFTTLLFIISAFTHPQLSFYIWWIAIIFSLFLPFLLNTKNRWKVTNIHKEASLKINPSFVERMWLLTIIIIWEVVISVVQWAAKIETLTFLHLWGFIWLFWIIVSIWWIYFDLIAKRSPIQWTIKRLTWIYLHLLLTMSIWLVSVWVLNTLAYADELVWFDRWIFIGPLISFLITIILLCKTLKIGIIIKPYYRSWIYASMVSIVLLFIIGFMEMWKLWTVLSAMFTLFIPVIAWFIVWVQRANRIITISEE